MILFQLNYLQQTLKAFSGKRNEKKGKNKHNCGIPFIFIDNILIMSKSLTDS